MLGQSPRLVIESLAFGAIVAVVLLLFVLPRYLGSAAMIVGCAVLMSAYLAAIPKRLRSRSGSLAPAIWLVALMWIAAALILKLSLIGQIRG